MLTADAAGPAVPVARDNLGPDSLRRGLASPQLPGLDAIRAIAALMVVYSHLGLTWMPAGLGVLAFFVLSGFLITWLLLKEHERYGSISLRLFYLRRALRIFPAFYVYAGVVIGGVLVVGGQIVWPQVFASLLYVNNYYQAILGDPNTGLSHTWSLGVEEQFYLLWPVAFVSLLRHPRSLGRWLIGVILFVWVYRAALSVYGVSPGYIYEAFDTRADHLVIGCLLAVALWNRWMPGLWRALCSSSALPVLTLALLAGSTILAFRTPGYRETIGFIVEPLLVGTLIVQWIALAESPAWEWTNSTPVRYLGRISYSIYLYQQITPRLVERIAGTQGVGTSLVVNTVVVVGVASASYWIVESPFLRIKDRIGRRAHG